MGDTATTLYDGELRVHYGFVHLALEGLEPAGDLGVAGQANGLCGARTPGVLTLLAGTHTGPVPLTILLLDDEPEVDATWQDVVEVSWESDGTAATLSAFDDWVVLPPVPTGTYRVRVSATGLDEAHDGTRSAGDPEVDRFRLELWSAPWSPDAVLRQTSTTAQWRHRDAAAATAPDGPRTLAEARRDAAQQDEERERAEQAEREASEDEFEQYLHLLAWGGIEPTPALESIGGRASQVANDDRALAEAIARAAPEVQRRLALRVARAACRNAGIERDDPVARALAALESGIPLPPPFHDRDSAYRWRFPGPRVVEVSGGDDAFPTTIDPVAAAIGAVLGAGEESPALAAVEALADASAAFEDRAAYLAEVHAWLSLQPD